jgi:hypothetical protein
VCPELKIDFPPSHRVLQLQLPSLTVPSPYCACAADAKQAAIAKTIAAQPRRLNAFATEAVVGRATAGAIAMAIA